MTYSLKGLPQKSIHDMDHDCSHEIVRYYEQGQIVRQEKDTNKDNKPDQITLFKDSKISQHQKDTNFDDQFDDISTFIHGKINKREKDTNTDGSMDAFYFYDNNERIKEIREDTKFTGTIDRKNIIKMARSRPYMMIIIQTTFLKPSVTTKMEK
ncbi:MAG: lipoprotein [Candidatus Magnetoglobus multicellularis str. Araruama]|uniref:Lipoprotein n=1 Tax=Candidatus Magnetoglobus multicellularis str. Araruama TaxID=890399 RepID=A0A1V1P4S8_9BACT|nr:MAG: lipoprotein [Candidatus Magnetoglobus multicellularis str. Araruama]